MRRAGCAAASEERTERPQEVVSRIFRDHGPAVRSSLTRWQSKVMGDIARCRTAALGGRLYTCDSCDYQRPLYNSCRNRHCPTCQSAQQARWIQERMARVLPCSHIHVVFTLPSQLRGLSFSNQRQLYNLLFSSAAQTLQELAADEGWLAARLGITAVLHTWTRKLDYHPHLHCLVTAGGLALDDERWIDSTGEGRYLFPVRVVSRLFRGKFLAGLSKLLDQNALSLEGPLGVLSRPEGAARLKRELYAKDWVVYAKRPFAGPGQVYRYLGRYTHRVGISPQRITGYDGAKVRFRTKDGGELTLPGPTFVRRFLRHVLPKRFTKIRHFGLYAASNVNTRLEAARAQLAESGAEEIGGLTDLTTFLDLVEHDAPQACPKCELGLLRCTELKRETRRYELPEPIT